VTRESAGEADGKRAERRKQILADNGDHMTFPILAILQEQHSLPDYERMALMGKALGAGLAVLGTGLGIGRIGGSMTEAMARQPEVRADIQTGAIILAALIEGAALFALVIAFLV
jgi:F-type H+-transporting ATPase subunit c